MVLSVFLILVSACSQQNQLPTRESALEVVDLQISPSLEHWLPVIAECADDIPGFGIYTQVMPFVESENGPSDLRIHLGPRRDGDKHVAVLGMETVTIVTGIEVPITSLSLESLRQIFYGEITNWGQVPEIMSESLSIDQPIQTLSYPDDHRLNQLFVEVFLEENEISSQPITFFNPRSNEPDLRI